MPEPDMETGVSHILSYWRKYVIFLRPIYAVLLVLVQLHWDNIWTYKHLHVLELEIVRKMKHYLK